MVQKPFPPSNPPAVSVVVAVYKSPDFLEKVLVSLQNQSLQNFEVLIADDGSGPDVRNLVRRYSRQTYFALRHIWHKDLGFRKTVIVNKAVRAAHGEYLVFIDGDTILHHRFVESHFGHRVPGVVLSGRRVNLSESVTQSMTLEDVVSKRVEKFSFWSRGCESNHLKHGVYLPFSFGIENFVRRRYSVLGCNFSMSKKDYVAINGYDERIIGRGLEDSNLYVRLLLQGFKVKTMARQALQYHLFHRFDPVPHSEATIRDFCSVRSAWTPDGLVKKARPSQ